ncbi:hypothetical protein CVT24_005855 [Panaeolus cyanescens]|uniref:Uncharacterized protein n=1 Tax=Panaeolus cyanescens TaxID=181874 RepID=A0A409YF15_9AGAR|nr:hypothetical protein CVT24_005855 [Panaeolus cyanescens]
MSSSAIPTVNDIADTGIPIQQLRYIRLDEPLAAFDLSKRQMAIEKDKTMRQNTTETEAEYDYIHFAESFPDQFDVFVWLLGMEPEDWDCGEDEECHTLNFNAIIKEVPKDMAQAFRRGYWNIVPCDLDLIDMATEKLQHFLDHGKERVEWPEYLSPRTDHQYWFIFDPTECTYTKPDRSECVSLATMVTCPIHPILAVLSTLRQFTKWFGTNYMGRLSESVEDRCCEVRNRTRGFWNAFLRVYQSLLTKDGEEMELKEAPVEEDPEAQSRYLSRAQYAMADEPSALDRLDPYMYTPPRIVYSDEE